MGVHLELTDGVLTVTGSDLDLTLSVTAEVLGTAGGAAVMPARLLETAVGAVSAGAVELSVTEGEASIVAGAVEFSIRLIPEEDYPQLLFTQEGNADGQLSGVQPGGDIQRRRVSRCARPGREVSIVG